MASEKSTQAAILNIGTELLVGHVLNTHAQYLTKWLNHLGYSVHYHMSCGDNPKRIQEALNFLSQNAKLILITGGLGPTQDDITRREVANFLGLDLERRKDAMAAIDNQFLQWGRVPTENNYLQADFPVGATELENPKGTAPGFAIVAKGLTIACLPGPPVEVRAVAEGALSNFLAGQGHTLYSRYLTLHGIGESTLDEQIADLFEAQTDPTIGIYAAEGMITLRLSTVKTSQVEADLVFEPVIKAIKSRVDRHLVSDKGLDIPQALIEALTSSGLTLAVAESCTGGLISKYLTDVAGASQCFLGGAVTYSNASKVDLLDVAIETLNQHGAVSEAVVLEMAQGAMSKYNANCGIAVSGIAGPGGGLEDKPVGTVCIAVIVNSEKLQYKHVFTQRFPGDRSRVRLHSALTAMRTLLSATCTLE